MISPAKAASATADSPNGREVDTLLRVRLAYPRLACRPSVARTASGFAAARALDLTDVCVSAAPHSAHTSQGRPGVAPIAGAAIHLGVAA